MIGIGMPISQRRSPRPIASSNNAVLRVGKQTQEPSNGSDQLDLMFQKQSRARRVYYQSMAKENAHEKACDWDHCGGDTDRGGASDGASLP
jgi:hypothetical protein